MKKSAKIALITALCAIAITSLFTLSACECKHEWSEWTNKSQTLLKYIVKQAGLGGLSQINSKRYSRYGCKHRFRYSYFDYSLIG